MSTTKKPTATTGKAPAADTTMKKIPTAKPKAVAHFSVPEPMQKKLAEDAAILRQIEAEANQVRSRIYAYVHGFLSGVGAPGDVDKPFEVSPDFKEIRIVEKR